MPFSIPPPFFLIFFRNFFCREKHPGFSFRSRQSRRRRRLSSFAARELVASFPRLFQTLQKRRERRRQEWGGNPMGLKFAFSKKFPFSFFEQSTVQQCWPFHLFKMARTQYTFKLTNVALNETASRIIYMYIPAAASSEGSQRRRRHIFLLRLFPPPPVTRDSRYSSFSQLPYLQLWVTTQDLSER